jgi:tetratricopeptide (TPR) repeat protein
MTTAPSIEEAERLVTLSRRDDAIAVLRAVLRGPSASPQAVANLGYLLIESGRPEEAVDEVEAALERWAPDLALLSVQGTALKAAGHLERAIAAFGKAVEIAPTSGVAEHNLASGLGDADRLQESEAAAARALAKGLDAAETWLVRGRALQGMGQFDEAESAYRKVLARNPFSVPGHADLAQLIWMRTEDRDLALIEMDAALARAPTHANLIRAKAKVIENIGDTEGAYRVFADALSRPDADLSLDADAALIACRIDPKLAFAHAQRAVAGAPRRAEALSALCQANFALGRPKEALAIAEDLRRRWPHDQFLLALVSLGWRMLGDPRHRLLHDYDRYVISQPLATPRGWSSLEAYLLDLAESLKTLHQLKAHPIGQSLRHGSQTAQCLTRATDPVIKAFFEAIDTPIRAYLDRLIEEGQVLGRPYQRGGGYRLDRAWSIRLKPDGFHLNHLHPRGWISSACYIELPSAVARRPEGWLQFGVPGIPTNPALPSEFEVQPRLGHLVLFPSYMWHGTVPFSGDEARMSAAMDVLPI